MFGGRFLHQPSLSPSVSYARRSTRSPRLRHADASIGDGSSTLAKRYTPPPLFAFTLDCSIVHQATQIWDDIGFGGKKGSIWNSPASMKNMAVMTDGALCCACGVSLLHDNSPLAGLALEFKDLKSAAFMASDGWAHVFISLASAS